MRSELHKEEIFSTLVVIGLLLAIALLAMCHPKDAFSESLSDLRKAKKKAVCLTPSIEQPTKVIAAGYDIPSLIYYRYFDLDGDLKADYYIEYEIMKVSYDESGPRLHVRPFPSEYFVDTDSDGYFDAFFKDVKGDGRCEDIVPFAPASAVPRNPGIVEPPEGTKVPI